VWDYPLRLLGALHYLVLGGEATWDDIGSALDEHRAFLTRWTQEQDVQTNEVQRAWALLPGFLFLADGRPFDLLELGPSAGLNLMWDRYRYRYGTGDWGTGALELTGDDRTPPPLELLQRRVSVARRRGIDLHPVDVTSEHGARILQAFVWPDQTQRLERLRRAIDVARDDPPQLIAGDYVELLPSLLADRRPDAQLVVFQTASTMYLEQSALSKLRAALQDAARTEPLVYLTTGRAPGDDGFALEIESYPDGRRSRLGVFDFHGEWLDWGR
jgi:hypothetical protein